MSIFDLVFIVLFLASVVTFLTAAILALRGQGSRAVRILRNYVICFAVYVAVVVIVALTAPQTVFAVGEDHCLDDWCLAVEAAERAPAPEGIHYMVTLRISSRAGRVSQREKGVNVYLTDNQGRRFDPAPDPTVEPLDFLLAPGQAVRTKRTFLVPAEARDIGLVLFHEGSYCFPGCFIIGDDGNPLHKRTIVRLP